MTTKAQTPLFVRAANALITALLRAGVRLVGFNRTPMYLLTVRGRKSGQPRTVPIALLERDGKRYLTSPYGMVNWVRNLRAAGEAELTRGGRSEAVRAIELPVPEAAVVLREEIKGGHPFARYFGVNGDSSLEDFEHAAAEHPLFVLEAK